MNRNRIASWVGLTLLLAVLITALIVPPTSASATTIQGDWRGRGNEAATYGGDAFFRGAGLDYRYGRPGDTPIVGDWDGDGLDELAVYRGRTIHFKWSMRAGNADVEYHYGRPGDVMVSGDWNGDGVDTVSVVRDGMLYVNDYFRGGEAQRVEPWNGQRGPDARGVHATLDRLGCGDVKVEFREISAFGLAYWHETPQRMVLNPKNSMYLVDTAAHECAHMLTWDAFAAANPGKSGAALERLIHSRLDALTGEADSSETIADCMAHAWGYEPGYVFGADTYCAKPKIAGPVQALLQGRAP